jgi:deltex-like protein
MNGEPFEHQLSPMAAALVQHHPTPTVFLDTPKEDDFPLHYYRVHREAGQWETADGVGTGRVLDAGKLVAAKRVQRAAAAASAAAALVEAAAVVAAGKNDSRPLPDTPSARGLMQGGIGVTGSRPSDDQDMCSICLGLLSGEDATGEDATIALQGCLHAFHGPCLLQCFTNGSLTCPLCNKCYGGPRRGTQPAGNMVVQNDPTPLPGQPPHVGRIIIHYSLPDGMQDDRHPSPGSRYRGTRRTALLPDTTQGQRVAAMLRVAFDRQLIFTVGQSVTLGSQGGERVVW